MAEMKTPDGRKLTYVDGFKIRNFLDDDFGIIHEYSQEIGGYDDPRFYIPKDEVWIDWRYADEFDFLYKEMVFKLPVPAASSDERRKAIKKGLCLPGPIPEVVVERRKENDLTVVIVDGKKVRVYIDPDFVLGGHELVYDYIPKGEIWIDSKIDPEETPFILLHERVERELMAKGKSYNIAHEYATVADKEERRMKAGARYPEDSSYPWYGKSNEEIIEQFVKL